MACWKISLCAFFFWLIFMLILWLDRYLFCCSYSHNVAPKGKFIAFVSTEAETDHPESELKPGIDLLGPVDEIFYDIYDRYEPVNEPSLDNCFISTVSYPQAGPMYIPSCLVICMTLRDPFLCYRVMMLPHTLSPQLWMCSTCIPS